MYARHRPGVTAPDAGLDLDRVERAAGTIDPPSRDSPGFADGRGLLP